MSADPGRVKELFVAALERPDAAARQAFLDRACGPDAALRQRLDVLLRAHGDPASVLERPLAEVASGGAAATGADSRAPTAPQGEPSSAESAGTLLAGRYQLLTEIGEGGMGTVWMARQTEPVVRPVALKVIKAGMDSKQVVARFEAERQALALMDHPHIAKVLDGGATPDGRPYFVMELVQGVPITDFCDGRRLAPRQRLELLVAVCQAVQHAHQKGVIHRDLKPSNVLVTVCDGRPVPKVIDFGVAKAAGPPLTDTTAVTGFGTLVGTPEYMSPEQAELNNLDVDTRSDVYSLGVLLYELLTGTTPLGPGRVQEVGLLEALRLIREEEAPRASLRLSTAAELPRIAACRGMEPGRLAGLVRGDLDWILLKCLEKDRARRFETADGLAQDLTHFLRNEPVLARPPSTGYRLRKFLRRNWGPVAAAAVVFLTLVCGMVGTTWGLVSADRRRAEADDALAAETQAKRNLQTALGRERDARYLYGIQLAHRESSAGNLGRAGHLLEACPLELRRWEWRYLKRVSRTEGVIFQGHPGPLLRVAFSPDGKYLAAVSQAGVKVWATATGREALSIPANPDRWMCNAAFSPDGERLVTAGEHRATPTGELRFWDLPTGRQLNAVALRTPPWGGLAHSRDGKHLAWAGTTGGEVHLCDATTGRTIATLPVSATMKGSQRLAFSPDGRRLAAVHEAREVKVFDVATLQETCAFRGHQSRVYALAFSPDGKRVASAGEDVRVWDAATGREFLAFRGHSRDGQSLAFSPDGDRLVSAGADGALKIWEAAGGREILNYREEGWSSLQVDFHPDGKRIVGPHGESGVKIWEPTPSAVVHSLGDSKTAGYFPGAFSADGDRLALRGAERLIQVREVVTGRLLATLEGSWPLQRLNQAFSPDGHYFAGLARDLPPAFLQHWSGPNPPGGADRQPKPGFNVLVWDARTGRPRAAFGLSSPRPSSLAFSSAGLVAVGHQAGTVTVHDARTGLEAFTLRGPPNSAMAVAFSPDGSRLASASRGVIQIWDTATGSEVGRLAGQQETFTWLAFNPTGDLIASASLGATAKVWDVTTGRELVTLRGHTDRVLSVVFSRCGRLATASHDGTVKVWDAATGTELLTLAGAGRGGWMTRVAFSADGRRLAAQDSGRTILVWQADAPPT